MGKLSDRIKQLSDYPGKNSPQAPPTQRRSSEQLGVDGQSAAVTNRIAAMTSEDVIHRMESSEDLEMSLNMLGNTTTNESSSVAPENDELRPKVEILDAPEDLGQTMKILLSAGMTKTLPDLPATAYERSSIEFKDSGLFSEKLLGNPDALPHTQGLTGMNHFDDSSPVVSESYQVHTKESILDFFSTNSDTFDNMEYTVKIEYNNNETIYHIVDNDVVAVEVTIVDASGRISDIIEKYQEKTGQVIIPVEMTTIPDPVMPARHQVVKIGEKLFFMPISTEVTQRTESFLAECVAELEIGNKVEKEIMVLFHYEGSTYSTSMFTMRELTYIVSSLRKYNANLHQGQGSLKLVAGAY